MDYYIEETNTDSFGHFDLSLNDIPENELVLVVASGGQDIDPNDDGLIDGPSIPNNGFLHALVEAGDARGGDLILSPISEISWQYTRNLIEEVHPDDLKIRLNDIADVLFASDINTAGQALGRVSRFNPLSDPHRQALNFEYGRLLGENSLVSAIHEGADDTVIRERIKQVLGNAISFNPAVDLRYKYAKVTLVPFGDGRIEASSGNLFFDSNNPDANVLSAFYPVGESFVLTATPAEGSKIAGWRGADVISEDLRECTVIVTEDAMILPTFVVEDPVISERAVDLSKTFAIIEGSTYILSALSEDTETISKMESLVPGDYIVSSQPPYFIREVVTVMPGENAYTFIIETAGVDIENLIIEGTGFIQRELTHDDLSPEEAAQPRTRSLFQPDMPIKSGSVKLLPPKGSGDNKFVFSFSGEEEFTRNLPSDRRLRKLDATVDAGVVFTTKEGTEISLSGELVIELDLDFAMDFKKSNLEEIRCIPKVETEQYLNLNVSGTAFEKTKEKKLGTIDLGQQVFLIGYIPVVINEQIDIIAQFSSTLEGSAGFGVSARQVMEFGFEWEQNRGMEWKKNVKNYPREADALASATLENKAYIGVEPKVLLYKLIGPEIGVNAGFNFTAEAALGGSTAGAGMSDLNAILLFFLYAEGKIDVIDSNSKLIQSIKEKISITTVPIYASASTPKEWPLKEWTIVSGEIEELKPMLSISGEGKNYEYKWDQVHNLPSPLAVYSLANNGDEPIEWEIEVDGNLAKNLTVTPQSGTLEPGATAEVRINRLEEPEMGQWSASIRFMNETHSKLPDFRSGTTRKPITLDITPPYYTPVITDVTSIGKDFQISWTSPTDWEMQYIDGYRIWAIDETGAKSNLQTSLGQKFVAIVKL